MMRQREDLDLKFLNTPFDRQVRIQSWNQNKLGSQIVLCLGAGGLGSVIIMNLLRLGVKKIIIVDYDKVDIHNLNRQIMYTQQDVGKSKVQSCIKNSKFHNVGNTEVVGFQGDITKNWQKIIAFAKESDIIFNMIDYGDWFDASVQSLCFALNKPFIQGGTFSLSLTVDFFSTKGKPCYVCLTDQIFRNKELIQKITVDKILGYQNLSFLPKNNNPIGRSSICVCTICGQFMISHYLNYLFFAEGQYKTQRLIFYLSTFEVISFPLEAQKRCNLCGNPQLEEQTPKQVKESSSESTPILQKNENPVNNENNVNPVNPVNPVQILNEQSLNLDISKQTKQSN